MPDRHLTATANRSGRRGLGFFLTLAAATGGVTAILVAVMSQQSAPQPPQSAGTIVSPATAGAAHSAQTPGSGRGATAEPAPTQPPAPPPLADSVPTWIDISAIDVHSSVISIGKAADGTLAVPQPGPDLDKAAWYKDSVTPGQDGPSVIEGHIDSVYGPSVFFQLGALRPGDTIDVTRADHSVVSFAVDAVRAYASHAQFPTSAVYGADLARPTLRLITCSNFDDSTGHYVGNTVVFAHLTAVHNRA